MVGDAMRKMVVYYIFNLKIFVSHRFDFTMDVVNLALNQCVSLLFLFIISNNLPSLVGWSMEELLLMYGFFLFNKGIADLVTSGLYNIEKVVQKGTLDSYLIKPMPILQQIISSKIDFLQIINLSIGVVLVLYTSKNINILFTLQKLIVLFIYMMASIVVTFSLRLATMSIVFWTQTSFPVAISVDNLCEFAKYPLNIYDNFLERILTVIFPYAFFAYFPTLVLLGKGEFVSQFIWVLLVVPTILMVALLIWRNGLKRYESSGH